MGSRACSSRSLTLTTGFAGVWTGCPPRARRRAPNTELGVTTAAPKANTTSTTVTNTTMVRISRGILYLIWLNLNLNNLSNHEISDGLQRNGAHKQDVAKGIMKKRLDKVRTEYEENGHDRRRHGHEQGHGQAALRGVNPHL